MLMVVTLVALTAGLGAQSVQVEKPNPPARATTQKPTPKPAPKPAPAKVVQPVAEGEAIAITNARIMSAAGVRSATRSFARRETGSGTASGWTKMRMDSRTPGRRE